MPQDVLAWCGRGRVTSTVDASPRPAGAGAPALDQLSTHQLILEVGIINRGRDDARDAEHGLLTIKNSRGDLAGFAARFTDTNRDDLLLHTQELPTLGVVASFPLSGSLPGTFTSTWRAAIGSA
jgi:hypothetical protein